MEFTYTMLQVTLTKSPEVRDALKQTGNINRLLHDSPYVTKVYGIHEFDDRVVLLMEEAIASLRDINRDTPKMKALKKELLETKTPRDMAREILQVQWSLEWWHDGYERQVRQ